MSIRDSWLKALDDVKQQPPPRPEGAVTASELMEALGVRSTATVTDYLRRLKRAGKVRVVTIRQKDRLGRLQSIPAYILKDHVETHPR